MTVGDLVKEFDENVHEIIELALSVKEISIWDKAMWTLGAGVGVAGVLLAPPTGGASLLVTVASFGLIVADAIKKVNEIRGNDEIRSKLAALEARNSELQREIRRRFP